MMLKRIKSACSNKYTFWLLILLFYSVVTLIIFNNRLPHIFTQYGMPDIDTDGGLWYQWYKIFTSQHKILPDISNVIAYPFGFDYSFLPFSNLIYSIQIFVLEHIVGFSWSNLVFVTNVSSLITYPLSAMGAAFLAFYLTKNKKASFLAGLIFSFSFYHVHMARGEMSINHIEIIPFYFLSLFYFLDKKTKLSLLISTFIFGILFNADAYYAFFSGILSLPIVFVYQKGKLAEKILTSARYYIVLFLVLILTNLNFIIPNLYLFDKTQAVLTGRNSIPKNELLNILFYFSPQPLSFASKIPFLGDLFYIVVPLISLSVLLFLKKNRLYVSLLIAFLIGVVLSSYIEILYWINILYFQYFGIFRGVARIILPTYLFLGLLFAISFSFYEKTKKYRSLNPKLKIFIFLLLIFIILLTSLNIDPTWTRRADFSKIAKLYQPIKENNNINVIASYPMTTNGQPHGCPQGYLELGQIIHQKSFACGASPFSINAQNYYRNIGNIADSKLIDKLTRYNVDTILIYNRLQLDAGEKVNDFKHDDRLIFLGRFQQPYDEGYVSVGDRSRDISVFQIKKVVENNRKPKPLIYSSENSIITYSKVSAYKYLITVKKLSASTSIIFDQPFSKKWKIYPGDQVNENPLAFLFKKPVLETNHGVYKEYANSWNMDAIFIESNFPKNSYILNKDGSIDMTLTLYFVPYSLQFFGNLIFDLSFLFLVLCLVFHFRSKIGGKIFELRR